MSQEPFLSVVKLELIYSYYKGILIVQYLNGQFPMELYNKLVNQLLIENN